MDSTPGLIFTVRNMPATGAWSVLNQACKPTRLPDFEGPNGILNARLATTKRLLISTMIRECTPTLDTGLVSSYSVGKRFMVLESQRINVRIDYARSDDNSAYYLSVGEAFDTHGSGV